MKNPRILIGRFFLGKPGKAGASAANKDANNEGSDVELSEVSEKDMEEGGETREVRMKDPSMSPIDSDASDSYNKVRF